MNRCNDLCLSVFWKSLHEIIPLRLNGSGCCKSVLQSFPEFQQFSIWSCSHVHLVLLSPRWFFVSSISRNSGVSRTVRVKLFSKFGALATFEQTLLIVGKILAKVWPSLTNCWQILIPPTGDMFCSLSVFRFRCHSFSMFLSTFWYFLECWCSYFEVSHFGSRMLSIHGYRT